MDAMFGRQWQATVAQGYPANPALRPRRATLRARQRGAISIQGPACNTASSLVGRPFACNGQQAIARITGGALTVSRQLPLASLFNQLNSRFDQYSGSLCSYATAAPDTNIKSSTLSN